LIFAFSRLVIFSSMVVPFAFKTLPAAALHNAHCAP
jgi:hypothetical protein